jgi:hypothetical protein
MPERGRREEWKEARDAIEERMRRLLQRGKEEKKIIPPSAWGTDGNKLYVEPHHHRNCSARSRVSLLFSHNEATWAIIFPCRKREDGMKGKGTREI